MSLYSPRIYDANALFTNRNRLNRLENKQKQTHRLENKLLVTGWKDGRKG